jgi:hypothetical protein
MKYDKVALKRDLDKLDANIGKPDKFDRQGKPMSTFEKLI